MSGAISPSSLQMPKYLTRVSPVSLFGLCQQILKASPHVRLDASQVEFIDPLGLAVLGALLEMLGHSVTVDGLSTDLARYLQRMDFFNRCQVDGVNLNEFQRHDRATSLVELTKVDDAHRADETAHALATALIGRIPESQVGSEIDDPIYVPLRYVLAELLNNALTHARRHDHGHASVWVAAQYFASSDLVQFAVVDNGCGMLTTLQHHRELVANNHHSSILTALLPRVSCNRGVGVMEDAGNEGVGLTTTANMIRAADGQLFIATGDGAYRASPVGSLSWPMRGPAYWSGVAVTFACERQKLVGLRAADHLPTINLDNVRPRFT